ncbi:YjdJ family protein [Sporosarcina sp. ACRSM]|uniref:YjdJ family protein n=1 Tax=Sporosarcina sp. ACRSM TaxID=2918216 RepID=UPI001EF3DACE|nr:YjdJ family protein [Sporosarcina sp. ACRSM]MCG7333805.1 YjdJ family protein [Sporosarcina sp. ACRSM]
MSFKMIIQLILASLLLVFSTGAAWYEGSTIVEIPWEWQHTVIFSQMANGQVEDKNDILQIDYFVYAAKFAPTFPLLMLLSATYLIILMGYTLLKCNGRMFEYFLFWIGVSFLVLSGFVSKSPTIGLKIFFVSFLVIGILLIGIGLFGFLNDRAKRALGERENETI